MLHSKRQRFTASQLDWLLAALAALLTIAYLVGLRRIFASWNPDLKDYTMWYEHIVQFGRWRSLNGSFASYSPPYIYVLSLASNLNSVLPPVIVLKLLNLPFMLASGYLGYSICRALGCSQRRAAIGGWLIVVAPEVVANALVWGQTDILETTFVLLFVRILLARRPGLAMTALGVALSFKLQVIFLAPAVAALLLTQELPLWSVVCTPLGYLAMMIPAELAGRPFSALYGVYSAQTQAADRIAMGAPNLFSLISLWTGNGRVDAAHPFFVELSRAGVVLAALLSVLFIWYLFRNRPLLPGHRVVLILAISALMEPFLLPKMHDRYFYIGDVLVLLLGLVDAPMLIPAVLLQMMALLIYGRYLIGFHTGSGFAVFTAALVAVALWLVIYELWSSSARRAAHSG